MPDDVGCGALSATLVLAGLERVLSFTGWGLAEARCDAGFDLGLDETPVWASVGLLDSPRAAG